MCLLETALFSSKCYSDSVCLFLKVVQQAKGYSGGVFWPGLSSIFLLTQVFIPSLVCFSGLIMLFTCCVTLKQKTFPFAPFLSILWYQIYYPLFAASLLSEADGGKWLSVHLLSEQKEACHLAYFIFVAKILLPMISKGLLDGLTRLEHSVLSNT